MARARARRIFRYVYALASIGRKPLRDTPSHTQPAGGDQPGTRRAAVLTVSDGVVAGTRKDESGQALEELLAAAGYSVVRRTVPDEQQEIEVAIRELAAAAELVVTTGGTGLGPRDVTPEATRSVTERDVPGLPEAMRAAGREKMPAADLSRGVAGAVGRTLVLNVPGSPRGAVESLEAIIGVIPHALDLLAGHTSHGPHAVAPQGAPPAGDLARDLTHRLARAEEVVLATAVRTEGDPPCRVGQKILLSRTVPLAGTLGCSEFDDAAAADAPAVLDGEGPVLRVYHHDLGSVEVYLEPYRPPPRLVVMGATPVALWLLRWGRDLGFDPVLVEPRPGRALDEHRQAASQVVPSPEGLEIPPPAAVVHTDHDAPLVAEHVAPFLAAGAGFVGIMGSARHAGHHLDRLRELGAPPGDVARIQTPVGLDLGARTPQEIALSILGGILAARSRRGGGWLARRPAPSVEAQGGG